ncbi:MAG: coenzyme F420-0:L-glutamate ligase [Mycobacteriales bacterium]
MSQSELRIWGVAGLPEVVPGADVAELIAAAEPGLVHGDVVVVTSKIVSKAEGRFWRGDRESAIDSQTVRVVAARERTRIVVTRQGYVLAAAGVDESNVAPGNLLLLPEDPDASARRIRAGLALRLNVDVGVIVSDTFGRPWRVGLTDVALGVAGLDPLVDLRGRLDEWGRRLDMTVTAIADELAGAAELVKGKLDRVPVAVIRGLAGVGGSDGPGGRALIRPAEEDLFPLGAAEAARAVVAAARARRDFAELEVPAALLTSAIADEPAVAPLDEATRTWLQSLVGSSQAITELHAAPALLLVRAVEGGGSAPLFAAGAACERTRLRLAAEGLASWWVFVPDAPIDGTEAGPPVALMAVGWPADARASEADASPQPRAT